MPLQLSGLTVQREDAIGIQIVPGTLNADVLLGRVSGRPIHNVELWIVASGEPRRSAAMSEILALPRLRARLARFGNAPESPDFLAGGLVQGGYEPVRAALSTANTGDHEMPRRNRR